MKSKFDVGRYLSLPFGGFDNLRLYDGKHSSPLMPASGTEGRASSGDAGPSTTPATKEPVALNGFTLSPDRVFTIRQSTSTYGLRYFRKRTSEVAQTAEGTDHRRFRWLDYVPGEITCLPLEGAEPVLTGKFTGCWLVIFEVVSSGKKYVGHIGTADTPDDERTKQAKGAWEAAVKDELIRPIKAIRPSETRMRSVSQHRPDVYGLVTPDEEMYTTVWQSPTTVGAVGVGPTVRIDQFARAAPRQEPDFGAKKAGSSTQEK